MPIALMMPRRNKPTDYITCYEDSELIDGKLEKALVIILRTKGCSWAHKEGCLMCGYGQDAYDGEVFADALQHQFDTAMDKYKEHKIVKIFNSGSFLSEDEIPLEVQTNILKTLSGKTNRIVIETRPEYVTDDTLEQVGGITNKLEIALGLETANDIIRDRCVNKNFSFDDYKKVADLISDKGLRVRTYLLLKPPFLTEFDAIEDVWQSMERIKDLTDVISINPVNIQKGTLVERLWQDKQYRPPYLWSLLEIFKRVQSWRGNGPHPVVLSHPSGAGTRRGIHNCPKCDKTIISAVKEFSQTQSHDIVENALKVKCDCYETFLDLCEVENFTFTATGRIN